MARSQLNLRLPPGLHEALKNKAKTEGISLNMLCVALLAGGIGWVVSKDLTGGDDIT